MTCWPTQSSGDLDAVAPNKIDNSPVTIQFEGRYDISNVGPNSNGLMEPISDPDVYNRGGGYVDKIEVFVKGQVKAQDGSWNDVKSTSSSNRSTLHCTEKNTYQKGDGPTKTFRTRSRAEITYCNGSVDQVPNGGGWQTSDTRDIP